MWILGRIAVKGFVFIALPKIIAIARQLLAL
jgi:hypothetical protein